MTKERLLGSHELQRTSKTPAVYSNVDINYFSYPLRPTSNVSVLFWVKIKI